MGKPRPVEDRVRDCIANHPDWDTPRVLAAIFGSSRELIETIREGKPVTPSLVEPKGSGTITLDSIRKRYDISASIKTELCRLKAGTLIAERELCSKTAGKDRNRFKRAVDNTEEFAANRIKLRLGEDTDGQWFWGSALDVAEAKRVRDE